MPRPAPLVVLTASLVLATSGVLGACSAPAKPAPIEGHTTAPAHVPAGPPPSVHWIDNGFDTPGLPAITADGALVVTAVIDSDGGRGFPNLRLVARDRHDGIGATITVLRVDEVDAMFDAQGRHPMLDARMEAANGWLAKLHADRELVPLTALEVDSTDAYTQHFARRGELGLDWQHDTVTITLAGKVIATHPSPPTWLAPDTKTCSNPAKLGGAWVDLPHTLALVQIIYNGTDMCWEPSAQLHVVTW